MLGNVKINLLLANNPRERVNPGETFNGNVNNGAMGQLQNMIPTIEKMLPKLDSIMTSLNTILADPAIKEQIDHKHRVSRFKFQTIPVYHNGLPIVIEDGTDFYK